MLPEGVPDEQRRLRSGLARLRVHSLLHAQVLRSVDATVVAGSAAAATDASIVTSRAAIATSPPSIDATVAAITSFHSPSWVSATVTTSSPYPHSALWHSFALACKHTQPASADVATFIPAYIICHNGACCY